MSASLVHAIGSHVSCIYDGVELFRYVYRSTVPATESPRPYFHPLRTPAGRTTTIFRPNDHRWHVGLSFAFANVSGESFWGGKSYVHPGGYTWLDNLGEQRHDGWQTLSSSEIGELVERLTWITHDGEEWINERREISVPWIHPSNGSDSEVSAWCLRFSTTLTNVAGRPLIFGSPTTAGRPAAGYGSLFWRGCREFSTGTPLTSTGITDADEAMGSRAEWAAYHCPFDGDEAWATMVFADHPDNPRYPTKWFVRKMPGYPAVSCAFTYDEPYELLPAESLSLTYSVVVGDGKLDAATIGTLLEEPSCPNH